MWRRQQPFWHAAMAVVWVAAVVVTLLDEPGPRGRGPSLALLGLMAVAYVVLGRRAMAHDDVRFAFAYHLIAWGSVLAIQVTDPDTQSWLMFFVLYSQLWAMLRARWAVITTFVVVTTFGFVRWAQADFATGDLSLIVISAVISAALSP